MDNLIAKISFKDNQAEMPVITIYRRNLKFKCQRFAFLCCRLGGPTLSQKDIERIERIGYVAECFSEPLTSSRFKTYLPLRSMMKNREDGSCIFLKIKEDFTSECSIHDHRPALCRLYPFYFEMIDSRSLLLRFIPCCNGLNDPEGKPVDETFISNFLIEAIIDLL